MINPEVVRRHENHTEIWKVVKVGYDLKEEDRGEALMEVCDSCQLLIPLQFIEVTEDLKFCCGFCLGVL